MRKKGIVLAALAFGLFVVYLIYSMTALAQVSCEVCIQFGGRSECRTASGVNAAEAQKTATDIACTFLGSNMTEGIACGNTPPTRVMCMK